jgi:hypothetical protein
MIRDVRAYVEGLSPQAKADLDKMLLPELTALWLPDFRNRPQVAAYYSQADLLLYGGAAGSGKTSLLVGLAATCHYRTVIFRSKSVDLRGVEEYLLEVCGRDGWNGQDSILRRLDRIIELGHLSNPGSEKSWQGRPHDFIGFDEGAQLSRAKVQFVMGWLRSADPKQRRRVVIASNPPTGGDGEWLMEWFAPWLDPQFANQACSGELRWAATAPDIEGTTVWLDNSAPIVFVDGRDYRIATKEEITFTPERARELGVEITRPMTRTFIPGKLEDNPYLRETGYRAQLQALPEPLRSQMLHGDFLAGRQDHEWQVIPSAWVKAAQQRWTEKPPGGTVMSAIGVDVAQGGGDDTVLAPRYGHWYAPLIQEPGIRTPNPSDVAALVVKHRRNSAAVVVDMGGGYGGGVRERLVENDIRVHPFNGAGESGMRTKDKQLPFVNKRAEAHWRFREALDPDQSGGATIALPPDPQMAADLTAPRWKMASRGIQIESKEDLKKPERLGRSPDRGDAVIMAWSEGNKAIIAAIKAHERGLAGNLPKISAPDRGANRGTGWMSR